MTEKIINLKAEEVLLLCSRIKNEDADFETKFPLARKLLLKLFSVFNELVGEVKPDQTEVPITITESEAWLMRSRIDPFDKVGQSATGILLLRKIHQAILDFNTEIDVELSKEEDKTYRQAKKEAKNELPDPEPDKGCPDNCPDNRPDEKA